MNPVVDSYRSLLVSWMKQKHSPPSPDKTTVCLNLLKIQQEQTGETLNPAAVLAAVQDSPLQFTDLFQRTECGKYRWQLMQDGITSENNPSTAPPPKTTVNLQESAVQIYQAYPRKISRPAALKEIKAAIKRMQSRDAEADAAAFLLERTRLFAASPAGNQGRYTPYPANWFDKERYLDDEKEWYATENRSGNLKREIVEEDETPGESFRDAVNRITEK